MDNKVYALSSTRLWGDAGGGDGCVLRGEIRVRKTNEEGAERTRNSFLADLLLGVSLDRGRSEKNKRAEYCGRKEGGEVFKKLTEGGHT